MDKIILQWQASDTRYPYVIFVMQSSYIEYNLIN